MTPDEYLRLSVTSIARRVATGHVSAREVIQACLAVIDQVNPHLNALTVIRRREALSEAAAVDASISAGSSQPNAPLLGVPIAVKEEYDVAGLPTTLGGWGNTTPAACDSEAIRRIRAAGAIIVAKTTMPEFGIFTDTVSERYGATLNPHHSTYSPGGSSGGSAAAVASGMVPVALGADGGGSVRIPASCCGVLGLKPARGRISPAPLTHHWHSLVTLGALSRTVEDLAIVNDVLSGSLPADRFTAPPLLMTHEAALASPRSPLTIAWSDRPVLPTLRTHPLVRQALMRTVRDLAQCGHTLRRTRRAWPTATLPFATQFIAGVYEEACQTEHPHSLEKRTRHAAAVGQAMSRAWIDSAIVQSERIGRLIDHRFLSSADVLLLPTMPVPVGRSGVLAHSGLIRTLVATSPYVANTALFNVSGHPAMSIPARIGAGQMPIGMQLVTRAGNEHLLMSLAQQLEELYGDVVSTHSTRS